MKKIIITIFALLSLSGCQQATLPQKNKGGVAVIYKSMHELPENARPNDATISLYEDGKRNFLIMRKGQERLYTIEPIGNSVSFKSNPNPKSKTLSQGLEEGYLLSYLYYKKGTIIYDGKATKGRFSRDVTDETIFFTHSTGKSITSYVLAHAICDGYINSIDERLNWPMFSKTLYNGQSIRDLINMKAGDRHTVNRASSHVMGSSIGARDMDLYQLSNLLKDTQKKGNKIFYNNVLADITAGYLAFRTGDNYNKLMRKVFNDKVKIEHPVTHELRAWSPRLRDDTNSHEYIDKLENLVTHSYHMRRYDFLRLAEAMMLDYQNNTCVGKYLREAQQQAVSWYKYRPGGENTNLWLNHWAKKYGAYFYFDFYGMSGRNIIATEGRNSQNILIDLDNSRIVVTNSAATAWDVRVFMLDVIKTGKLPK